jgi:hypothetical protein
MLKALAAKKEIRGRKGCSMHKFLGQVQGLRQGKEREAGSWLESAALIFERVSNGPDRVD